MAWRSPTKTPSPLRRTYLQPQNRQSPSQVPREPALRLPPFCLEEDSRQPQGGEPRSRKRSQAPKHKRRQVTARLSMEFFCKAWHARVGFGSQIQIKRSGRSPTTHTPKPHSGGICGIAERRTVTCLLSDFIAVTGRGSIKSLRQVRRKTVKRARTYCCGAHSSHKRQQASPTRFSQKGWGSHYDGGFGATSEL